MVGTQNAGAYVSVYLSSEVGRVPVRDVLRLGDNKSDPNLETQTYGLFSTCEPTMRKSIAARGITEIFFVTSVEPIGRALVGQTSWADRRGQSERLRLRRNGRTLHRSHPHFADDRKSRSRDAEAASELQDYRPANS